jgi:hypothetical protein
VNDRIVEFLRHHPDGVSSVGLAEQFLRLSSPPAVLAERALKGILADDARCRLHEDGLWRPAVQSPSAGAVDLLKVDWTAVSLLADGRKVLHVSVWEPLPSPHEVRNEWLVDPRTLAHEDGVMLTGGSEEVVSDSCREDVFASLAEALRQRVPVFVSSRDESLLRWQCAMAGSLLTDDSMTLGHFFRAAGLAVPRPLGLAQCHSALFSGRAPSADARYRGRTLAECLAELLSRAKQSGIETREALMQLLDTEVESFDFSGKEFSHETLAALPQGPGVYGFRDARGTVIYIGKASNLRRRVSSYFHPSDESPEKLDKLRHDAVSLVTYPCGSELESLLYEYRLIRKHSPVLNTQAHIAERKGTFRPVDDCVVLLPHADPDKRMSVWFRRDQKIQMRALQTDLTDCGGLEDELQRFFYSEKLPPADSDFPEQEIAHRWLRRHLDGLAVVPASRMASGAEILEGVRSYCRQMEQAGGAG